MVKVYSNRNMASRARLKYVTKSGYTNQDIVYNNTAVLKFTVAGAKIIAEGLVIKTVKIHED